MPATELSLSVPGGTLSVEVRGAGPPLLLVHGVSANRRCWEPVARRLEAEHRLCLPDLLGRGASDPAPEARFRLADEVGRLQAAWRGLPGPPRLLVGHSQGALLCAVLAAREDAVGGLVLLNPVTPGTRGPAGLGLLRLRPLRRGLAWAVRPLRRPLARHILRRTYAPGTPVTAETLSRYAEPYADPRRAETLLRVLADWRPGEAAGHLPRRPLAVRVLAGAADRRIGTGAPAALAGTLGGPFEVVPGAGHVLPEERPGRVAEAIRAAWREMALPDEPGMDGGEEDTEERAGLGRDEPEVNPGEEPGEEREAGR